MSPKVPVDAFGLLLVAKNLFTYIINKRILLLYFLKSHIHRITRDHFVFQTEPFKRVHCNVLPMMKFGGGLSSKSQRLMCDHIHSETWHNNYGLNRFNHLTN